MNTLDLLCDSRPFCSPISGPFPCFSLALGQTRTPQALGSTLLCVFTVFTRQEVSTWSQEPKASIFLFLICNPWGTLSSVNPTLDSSELFTSRVKTVWCGEKIPSTSGGTWEPIPRPWQKLIWGHMEWSVFAYILPVRVNSYFSSKGKEWVHPASGAASYPCSEVSSAIHTNCLKLQIKALAFSLRWKDRKRINLASRMFMLPKCVRPVQEFLKHRDHAKRKIFMTLLSRKWVVLLSQWG